ncbi:isoliquiritigenin 2'-O-methyltransferase-like [Abrus precatorius]|uniref:Isoliquiritigenin 2'-O-methyltransferase-like n=1 Tax=Abrus precatorius TaxID=3816 RepID=A0A8B8M9L1_ABRPR|nr:isoliquiritigenin 2'-O-methyltransferase-like [Abrus precatorius]XP_027364678.1 isoliquiritigenin 2'-O-methyltransferase-like [Abrus precatorius]
MGSYSTSDVAVKMSPNEEGEDEACLHALLLCIIQVLPSALNAAVELKLFDIIAKGTPNGETMSASQIASMLPNQHTDLPNRIERMLRLLASYSLLTSFTHTDEDGSIQRSYGLSPVGKYFVNDESKGCAATVTSFLNYPTLSQVWPNLKDVIIATEKDLVKKVHGMSLYQCTEKDPKLNYIFNKSMANISIIEMNRVLEVYKGFEGVSTLVDVGGGTGQNLQMIISKYPTIKGINFDLPQVVEKAPAYTGIQHVGGDMFNYVPQGDAIVMKSVLHNWSDEECVSILRNCHNALPQDGKVIVMEFITPEASESNAAKFVSTLDHVMYITNGGMERTEKGYESLCKLSGFSRFQVACRAFSALGIIEFYK